MTRWLSHFCAALVVVVGLVLLLRAAGAASVDEMSPQMRQAYIVGIQEELAAHGYRAGPADGRIGWETQRAVERYQRDAGLPVDGVLSNTLLDHLKFAKPEIYAHGPATPAYESGRHSAYERDREALLVRDVQSELRTLGYYHGAIDGIAGPNTRAALRRFRIDAGLPPENGVSDETLRELRAASLGVRQ